MTDRTPTFSTLDVYVAAYLVMCVNEVRIVLQGSGKVSFRFADSAKVQADLANFEAGAVVKASEFGGTIKDLKRRMYGLKENGRPYGNFRD
jgi:hypothetical protein